MLQAHSFLWHYVWLAPHVLQLGLAIFIVRRGLQKSFPLFLAYLLAEAAEEFTLYTLDVLPSVSGETFWKAFCFGLILEGLLKIAVVGELFSHLVHPWPAIARVGNRVVSGVGAVLVLIATLAAAYAPIDNPAFALISRAHILQQSLYIVECGLILLLFAMVSYFHLEWESRDFGLAIGLGILFTEHMASWALSANGFLLNKRHILDILTMGTYHICVLIWIYYFLMPPKIRNTRRIAVPEHNLDVWNRELERLLQQ